MKPSDPDQEAIDNIQEVLTDLVKSMVKSPDEARVTSVVAGPLVALVIKTAQDDVRRIIGSQGKRLRSLEAVMTEAFKRLNRESHITIDEKTGIAPPAPLRQGSLGDYNAKRFKDVKELLKRVITVLVTDKKKLAMKITDLGPTMIVEIKVAEADYPALYGRPAEFDYGTDGHLIGAIKNIFDGIGKNNGRVIRIVVEKV